MISFLNRGTKNKILRDGYIWNTASGMIGAAQSAIIMIFISRFMGIEEAGIFSLGYALANIVFIFAKYGERNYQVTDVREEYSFSAYFSSRIITVIFTLLLLLAYIYYCFLSGNYSWEKSMAVLYICLWKMIDSVEDVFFGMYQQRGRLDIAGKYYTARLLSSTIIYCIAVALGLGLASATAVTLLFSIVFSAVILISSFSKFDDEIQFDSNTILSVKGLLLVCFPLCIAMTLSNFIGNIPKYAIDWCMDDTSQGYFGYIMMPAFVILILSNFIYQPVIRNIGECWERGNRKEFNHMIFKQYGVISALIVLVIAGGFICGIPVLSVIYGVDLAFLKNEFLVLLLGGGVYALVSFAVVPITAMRRQKIIMYCFAVVSVISIMAGKLLVNGLGIMGAALLYLLINVALTICFTLVILKE